MKQLLVFLLIVNAVFFVFEQYVRPGVDALPTEVDGAPKLDPIVLVKELPPMPQVQVNEPLATANKPTPAQQPTTVLTTTPDTPLLLTEPSVLKTFSLPQEPAKPAVPSKPELPPVAIAEPPPSPPAIIPNINIKVPLPQGEGRVREFNSPEGEGVHARSSTALADTPATPPAPSAPTQVATVKKPPAKPSNNGAETASHDKTSASQCRQIGPLSSEADAQALKQQMSTVADKISVEHKPGKAEEIGYWVLYAPTATLATARTNKELLAQKGFTTTSILNSSEHEYAVSLGFFKERANANKLQNDPRLKGMGIIVKPRTNQRDEYWLKLQIKSTAALASPWHAWQAAHPTSPARDNACP